MPDEPAPEYALHHLLGAGADPGLHAVAARPGPARLLRDLQAQAPEARLTLKCPHHLAWLPALARALPEACIIQTHRDPKDTLPSELKLQLSMHAMATDELDVDRLAGYIAYRARTLAERAVVFAESEEGRRVLHVSYADIVKDPVELVLRIRRHFGLETVASDEARLRAYAAANRQHRHGKNPYSLADFGLQPAGVDGEFAAYRRRFLDVRSSE